MAVATISVNYATVAEVTDTGPASKSISALTLSNVLSSATVPGGYARLVGDTMTGTLTLPQTQDVSPYSAIHKNYLDTRTASSSGIYIKLNNAFIDANTKTRYINFVGTHLSVASAGEEQTLYIPSPLDTVFAGEGIDIDASTTTQGGVRINASNNIRHYTVKDFVQNYGPSPTAPVGSFMRLNVAPYNIESDNTYLDTVILKRAQNMGLQQITTPLATAGYNGAGFGPDANKIYLEGVVPFDLHYSPDNPSPQLTLHWYSTAGQDGVYAFNYYKNKTYNANIHPNYPIYHINFSPANNIIIVAGSFNKIGSLVFTGGMIAAFNLSANQTGATLITSNLVYGAGAPAPYTNLYLFQPGPLRVFAPTIYTGALTNIPGFASTYFENTVINNKTVFKTLSAFVPSVSKSFFATVGDFEFKIGSAQYRGLRIFDTTNGPGSILTYFFYCNGTVYDVEYDGSKYLYIAGAFNLVSLVGNAIYVAPFINVGPSYKIARIDLTAATPTLDIQFGLNTTREFYSSTKWYAKTMEMSTDRKILYVGGHFSSPYSGDQHFTALDMTDTVLGGTRVFGAKFDKYINVLRLERQPTATYTSPNPGNNYNVLYVGGAFTSYTANTVNPSTLAASSLIKYSIPYFTAFAVPQTDARGFQTIYNNYNLSLNNLVTTIEVSEGTQNLENGCILIGGAFKKVGKLKNPPKYLAAVTKAAIGGSGSAVALNWAVKPNNTVYHIRRVPNTSPLSGVMVAGQFNAVNGFGRQYLVYGPPPQETVANAQFNKVRLIADVAIGSDDFDAENDPNDPTSVPDASVILDNVHNGYNTTTFALNSAFANTPRGTTFRVKVQRDYNNDSDNNAKYDVMWVAGATLDFNSKAASTLPEGFEDTGTAPVV